MEQYYTPREVAQKLAVSYRTVLRLFRDDPNVFRFGTDETVTRRGYISIRIPQSSIDKIIHKSPTRTAYRGNSDIHA